MIIRECALLLSAGVPLWGVCWYPVIDRPDWDNLAVWHESGLWDGVYDQDNTGRILHEPSANALMEGQNYLRKMILSNSNNREFYKKAH